MRDIERQVADVPSKVSAVRVVIDMNFRQVFGLVAKVEIAIFLFNLGVFLLGALIVFLLRMPLPVIR